MNDIQSQIQTIKHQLRLAMNGVAADSMRRKGLVYKLNFGVELPRLKAIAMEIPKHRELAQALWHEEVRECKILATLLYPADEFLPEVADIWVGEIQHLEIAEQISINLLQHLSYAPAKSFQWIADEREMVQVCGFMVIARLLRSKGEMSERAASEFLDQSVSAFLNGSYMLRSAVATALRSYMQYSETNAFQVCRFVEPFASSERESEQLLYQMVKDEVEP